MNKESPTHSPAERGATVVITHRIKDGSAPAYEAWLNGIGPVCRSFPGHLDWQIIRPIAGLSGTYTVVIRFDTEEHLRQWMHSDERKRYIADARPLFAEEDRFHISTGLDIWFAPEGAVSAPMRWKQALVTLSAIYPLVLGVPLLLSPLLRKLGVTDGGFISTFIVAAVVVWLMAYVVMPNYTKLIRRWLFA
ncbi:MAG: antibiotic biosynthesis monooxygenase [Flavobacteriales bacterium]